LKTAPLRERRRHMKHLVPALLLLMSPLVWATPITIGDTSLDIPNPPGFVLVTPEMATTYQWLQNFVPSGSEQFAAYIPESDVPQALRKELLAPVRLFRLVTTKKMVNDSLSPSEFVVMKQIIKTQNQSVMTDVERSIPGLLDKANKAITSQSGIGLTLLSLQMVPLPPHYETDCAMAYSAFMQYQVRDAAGSPVSHEATGTMTYLYVKGKFLTLHGYAEPSGLQWTRDVSRQWVDSIVAANSSGSDRARTEYVRRPVAGIDWKAALARGFGYVAIGAVIGLGAWAIRRLKKE
jgi:hypothetical protein